MEFSRQEYWSVLPFPSPIEYYSAIKRNTLESVLMRWMNVEPIIQSEVSQKEKEKYCSLMHIYGIEKNGAEGFIYRTAIENQT